MGEKRKKRREFLADLLFVGGALTVGTFFTQMNEEAQGAYDGWVFPKEIDKKLKATPQPGQPRPQPRPRPRPQPRPQPTPRVDGGVSVPEPPLDGKVCPPEPKMQGDYIQPKTDKRS